MSHYGTLVEGELYFGQRLHSQAWDRATNVDRTKGLYMATRAIDRLNYAFEKYNEDQELQFPRGDDTEVPVEIRYAAYECALRYLEGVDIEQETRNIGISSSGFNGARTSFQDGMLLEHLRAGIPSVEAWHYLRPFLRDPADLTFSRGS